MIWAIIYLALDTLAVGYLAARRIHVRFTLGGFILTAITHALMIWALIEAMK